MSYIGAGKKVYPDEKFETIPHHERIRATNAVSAGALPPQDPMLDPIQDPIPLRDEKVKRSCGARWWTHYKRFWCLYLIVAIILLAILLPILFLVIIPAIAQDLVNKQNLPIISASIMDPTPDSITIGLVANLNIPKPFTVTLEPLNLSLYDKQTGVTFLTVPLPEYHLKGNATITVQPQTVQILNMTEWVNFLHVAVYSKNFTMSCKGATTARIGSLKAHITLDKDVTLNGLNMLDGFQITSAELLVPPQNGANLGGVVVLPNPSVVTFAMGNQTLNLMAGDLVLGYGTLYNVVLTPGNNSCAFTGSLDILSAIEKTVPLLEIEASALTQGQLSLSADGNSTIYNGVHIPYYEDILNNLLLNTTMPILEIVEGTLGGFLNNSFGGVESIISNIESKINISALVPILSALSHIVNITLP